MVAIGWVEAYAQVIMAQPEPNCCGPGSAIKVDQTQRWHLAESKRILSTEDIQSEKNTNQPNREFFHSKCHSCLSPKGVYVFFFVVVVVVDNKGFTYL